MSVVLGDRILSTFQTARMAALYGLSETSGECIISASDDDATLVATLGVAIGDFELRITDDDHGPLPDGTEGQLHVRGGCIAAGTGRNLTRALWRSYQEGGLTQVTSLCDDRTAAAAVAAGLYL